MKQTFKNASIILKKLKVHNFEGFYVGGCVRDYHLERDISDVDITTNAKPHEVSQLFEKTVDTASEHGTIIVIMNGEPIEVTTYRVESDYTDHRRPDSVYFTDSLQEDLQRRDFTINAMAMNEEFKVFDPFGGRNDLTDKVVRTVGPPHERFSEDALRMLRAIRFSSQLGFKIDNETFHSITSLYPQISYVSIERIVVELIKIYDTNNPQKGKQNLVLSQLITKVPVLDLFSKDLFQDTVTQSLWMDIALQIDVSSSIRDELYKLKLSKKQTKIIDELTGIIRAVREGLEAELLSYRFNADHLKMIHEFLVNNNHELSKYSNLVLKAIELHPKLPIHSISDIDITGNDLMRFMGKKRGPWIKEVYQILEREILFGNLNNSKSDILKWMGKHYEI